MGKVHKIDLTPCMINLVINFSYVFPGHHFSFSSSLSRFTLYADEEAPSYDNITLPPVYEHADMSTFHN